MMEVRMKIATFDSCQALFFITIDHRLAKSGYSFNFRVVSLLLTWLRWLWQLELCEAFFSAASLAHTITSHKDDIGDYTRRYSDSEITFFRSRAIPNSCRNLQQEFRFSVNGECSRNSIAVHPRRGNRAAVFITTITTKIILAQIPSTSSALWQSRDIHVLTAHAPPQQKNVKERFNERNRCTSSSYPRKLQRSSFDICRSGS